MKKFLGIGAVILLIATIAMYGYFGGFKSPEISVYTMPSKTIFGKLYKGDIQNKAFGLLFEEMNEKAKENNALLCAIYYNNPDKTNGKVEAFVGFVGNNQNTDNELEKREINPIKVVKGTINARYLIIPTKIYPAIAEYAKVNNLILTDFAIETYFSDTEMAVEIEIK